MKLFRRFSNFLSFSAGCIIHVLPDTILSYTIFFVIKKPREWYIIKLSYGVRKACYAEKKIWSISDPVSIEYNFLRPDWVQLAIYMKNGTKARKLIIKYEYERPSLNGIASFATWWSIFPRIFIFRCFSVPDGSRDFGGFSVIPEYVKRSWKWMDGKEQSRIGWWVYATSEGKRATLSAKGRRQIFTSLLFYGGCFVLQGITSLWPGARGSRGRGTKKLHERERKEKERTISAITTQWTEFQNHQIFVRVCFQRRDTGWTPMMGCSHRHKFGRQFGHKTFFDHRSPAILWGFAFQFLSTVYRFPKPYHLLRMLHNNMPNETSTTHNRFQKNFARILRSDAVKK